MLGLFWFILVKPMTKPHSLSGASSHNVEDAGSRHSDHPRHSITVAKTFIASPPPADLDCSATTHVFR